MKTFKANDVALGLLLAGACFVHASPVRAEDEEPATDSSAKITYREDVVYGRLDDNGARIGPDLTGLGRCFSRVHLVESILQPSRTIERVSTMPEGLEKRLTEREFVDLIAFQMSQTQANPDK